MDVTSLEAKAQDQGTTTLCKKVTWNIKVLICTNYLSTTHFFLLWCVVVEP
jgi:hypothetical protein